jgi:3-phosphoshikimate 1-carboxyvinyltransferase
MSSASPKYPERLRIEPLAKPPDATVNVPGSKSITNRALVLAALAGRGRGCKVCGILRSEDTEVMLSALEALGFRVDVRAEYPGWSATVGSAGNDALIPTAAADLFVANSGTTMRFLTALVSVGHGRYRLDGVPRMRERPIEDLLAALRQLGVQARSELGNGCPPVVIAANGLNGGLVRIRGDVSSQFLSGLLMVAPLARSATTIEIAGSLVSQPYVAMTVSLMEQFGARIERMGEAGFHVPGGQVYRAPRSSQYANQRWFNVEPDASAASYFFGAAAITGGKITVMGLNAASLQGDVRLLDLLEQMGCKVLRTTHYLAVEGGPLRGIDADMNDISDTVMTLAAVACFAEGPTTIRNVAHIRHKESDRLAALAAELRRVGAEVDEFADGLTITPRPLHGAEIETYNDHRMAMSMALIGLKVPGVVIKDPGCVAKTYPHFFDDLERLR